MKRTIKFRGLRTDGKGWVYGAPFYISGERKCFIIDNCQSAHLTQEDSVFDGKEVKYRSVGQFTGMYDKNGVEIYEGDIIGDWTDVDGEQVQSRCLVFFDDTMGEWMINVNHGKEMKLAYSLASELNDFDYELTGNIHEKTSK